MEKKYLTVPFSFTKQVDDDEYYRFEGYASTYNNVDLGDDMVMKGAFENTLKNKRPKNIKLLYQHNMSMPLGVFDEIRDDEAGLYVRGKMPKECTQVRDVMALMKCGAIDSMSIGYVANKYDYDDRGVRLLKDIDLYEISLVTMPMNPKAQITSMKTIPSSISAIVTRLSQDKAMSDEEKAGLKALVASYCKQNGVTNPLIKTKPKAKPLDDEELEEEIEDTEEDMTEDEKEEEYEEFAEDWVEDYEKPKKKKPKKFYLDDVRSISTKRSFERCLRESGAFSRQAAMKLVKQFSSDSKTVVQTKSQLDEITKLINNL